MSAIGSIGASLRPEPAGAAGLAGIRRGFAAPRRSAERACRPTTSSGARVIEALLCHGVLVKREIESRFGIDFDEYFADALEKLEPCRRTASWSSRPGEVRATPLGRIFLRNLAMPFDAYLAGASEKPVFSRTL